MKILMSALACEPGKGSELEVGFRAVLAAAEMHEVWVLTNSATVPVVRSALEGRSCAERVHLEGIYFEVDNELYPRLTAPGFHRYYDRWQRRAAVRAAELDREIDFDVVHHVTLAAHWTRTGVTAVDKPLVWDRSAEEWKFRFRSSASLDGEAWLKRSVGFSLAAC